jgi:hypothetical protein
MKKIILLVSLLLAFNVQAQERDRRAELHMECRNPYVTHTAVAPDGSLWMVCSYSEEIFFANDVHSSWRTLTEAKGGASNTYNENITAFDRNTAVIAGNMWPGDIKRTSSCGLMWDFVDYSSEKGFEWFHPAWRGEEGRLWTGSQDGLLIFSADSGRTFTTLRDTAFDHKTGIDEIYMSSAHSGFIGCHDNSLYATTDNWHTYRRLPTPFDQRATLKNGIVECVRQWKSYLIAKQAGESFYTRTDDIQWKRTSVTLRDFEVDPATGRLWGVDDNGQVVLTEDLKHWKPMGVNALFTIGLREGRLYCRIDEGVIRVGAGGVVDSCPFLTTERPIEEPQTTLTHGSRLWGHDDKSVYLLDAEGWYRVARSPSIWSLKPDPDDENRVIIMSDKKESYSIDTAGRVEPYTYRQPTEKFVTSGLKSLNIQTYRNVGYRYIQEEINYQRIGDSLLETYHTVKKDSTIGRRLPVTAVEKALIALGECYSRYPTLQDFGMEDTTVDLHEVFDVKSEWSSSNKYGYIITFFNQEGDSLKVYGNTSSHVNLGGSTRFPWLLPMYVDCREATFSTYQPVLWQTLREAMPDSMFLKDYLDNSTLRPEEKLKNGDLLFMEYHGHYQSDMDRAIKSSTGSYTHVALVEVDRDGLVWIIDATPQNGVKRKTYASFERENDLHHSGTFSIYRLTEAFDTAAVIARAKSFVGQPYDDAFLPDNGKMYCSELIYECFLDASGHHLFESQPMNWRDKDGKLPEYWKKHFEELEMDVPEGVAGTNPTDMSKSLLLRKQ